MHLDRYELRFEGNRHFFFSEGPNGRVEKAILYRKFQESNIYNLAFGDWNEQSGHVDDTAVTNNGDTQKVLASVASSVILFMSQHPHAFILAVGSTPSRTRLYQIGIMKYLMIITVEFNIEGFRQNSWEPFRPGRNYDGFLISAKNCNFSKM